MSRNMCKLHNKKITSIFACIAPSYLERPTRHSLHCSFLKRPTILSWISLYVSCASWMGKKLRLARIGVKQNFRVLAPTTTYSRVDKAKAISAKLLELNLKNKLE